MRVNQPYSQDNMFEVFDAPVGHLYREGFRSEYTYQIERLWHYSAAHKMNPDFPEWVFSIRKLTKRGEFDSRMKGVFVASQRYPGAPGYLVIGKDDSRWNSLGMAEIVTMIESGKVGY